MSESDHERRQAFVKLCKELTSLSDDLVNDIETAVFNWSLNQADTFRVQKTWTNAKFQNIYHVKAHSILLNLDPTSYVQNKGLVERVRSGEVKPEDVPFMRPSEMFPERWREVVDLKVQREEYATNVKPVAMTDQFRCKRCKKRECVYQEVQLRSADEPATIIITCVSCSHTWRVG